MIQKIKILITGANGQLGNELRRIFDNDTYDIVALGRTELPLEQLAGIEKILQRYSPDIIVHGAAYTAVDLAETERELADTVNHLATTEIANYSASNNCNLIYISTDYVFGGQISTALEENHPTGAINHYGQTKLDGEIAVASRCPNAIIIRTSWVYSSWGRNFVKTMMRLMTEKDQISVVNDQIGSPTYARDLGLAIRSIINSENWIGGTYHYSNSGEISWFDFACAIKSLGGYSCLINGLPSSSYPTPALRPKYSLLDTSKIRRIYGLHIPLWSDSLKECIDIIQRV